MNDDHAFKLTKAELARMQKIREETGMPVSQQIQVKLKGFTIMKRLDLFEELLRHADEKANEDNESYEYWQGVGDGISIVEMLTDPAEPKVSKTLKHLVPDSIKKGG